MFATALSFFRNAAQEPAPRKKLRAIRLPLTAWIRSCLLKIRFLLIWVSWGDFKINLLRSMGVKIGKNCSINAKHFSTEPFLIEIGDHVAIATGTSFVTHDGSVWVMREEFPDIDVFGKITIGDNTFIGTNVLILAGTRIGSHCVIGAGSVVRGVIPDNSVAMGNPAKVVFSTTMLRGLLANHKHKLMTKTLGPREKKQKLLDHFKLLP